MPAGGPRSPRDARRGGRQRGVPRSSRDAPPRAASSSLSSLHGLPTVGRCRPTVPLAVSRPFSPHRPRRRPARPGGGWRFRPGLLSSSLPGACRTISAGRRGPARPEQLREGHRQRAAGRGAAPPGPASTAAGPASASAAAGCRAPPGLAPCRCPVPPPARSARLPPSLSSFLPSFLPCLPPLPRCQLSPARCQAAPCGSRRPPPAALQCRQRGARRRRSAPGSAAAAVTVCLCHVCAWAGGGAAPRRSQPAATPPCDRQRAPNHRQPRTARLHRAAPPGRYTWPGGAERGKPAPHLSVEIYQDDQVSSTLLLTDDFFANLSRTTQKRICFLLHKVYTSVSRDLSNSKLLVKKK
ncbi:sterile alpha motif domain-containing protein 1-like isoform X2 [Lagopus muta]|uniref:sterile alpha motif domain-containing protein 1-like isoform X2 n=1 Tax=Lagopus muta TaxID=64668 RepID=UPI00209EC45B|nr:sterile alpha motif domain-containing protein 1-like isoform X2 [Lagopus muta]XP_048789502.1 sterile alpha motif domain-containing protein 1-like isoform X2 [Lagopus muta]XP_048789510.1 sterile alpha motif domain-containing protein 1-like isoform X2 [Lagopus muta]XP_048789521.1 sterile alpha motif domain-containing protein 1-like isoform X2 [Lagopus muta]